MSKFTTKLACLFAALSVMAVAPAAMANHHGKPHHHGKICNHGVDNSVFITTDDKKVIREYLAQDFKDNCPKVMAKKSRCGAPTYSKKAGGKDVAYRPLPAYVVHELQPVPNDYHYVTTNSDVLLIHKPTKSVVDSVSLRD